MSQVENPENNDQEKAIIWDLEVWKRAEQAQFKAYLKQLEFEYLSKLQEDFKNKEEEREKEFKTKINEINNLKNKLSKKINDLESRENKIKICEEELKIRINEVSKQLVLKDEEISLIKKNAKDEQDKLNKNNTQLKKKLDTKQKEISALEEKFNAYKKDMENSPMSTLRNEITRKQIQYDELEKQMKNLENEIKNRDKTIENLKVEIIKLRKTYETEKENMYKQRLEEIEKLKFDIYNQRTSSEEMKEIRELKEKIKELSNPKKNENYENNNFNYMSGTMPMQYFMNMPNPSSPSKNKKIYTIISYNKRDEGDKPRNELEKLIMEKEQLLKSGMYKENDPLIFQLNNKIKRISESFGGN
jgi:centrosomal protein CEP120